MSKRTHDESTKSESQEERWLRKIDLYEQKIRQKRQRLAEKQLVSPPVEQDVEIEEHLEYDEGLSVMPPPPPTDSVAPNIEGVPGAEVHFEADRAAYLQDFRFDEYSQMTDTTAGMSPCSNACVDINEKVADVADVPVDDFDPDLLRALGEVEKDPVEFGDDLQTDVAAKFQKILLEGLKKEKKEELIKKYPIPKNVPLAKSPTLNPEIAAMLVDTCKLRDKRLLTKQDQLGKVLSALGKALTGLLKKTSDIPDVIRTLNDAGMLLADSHYAETDTRRSVIIPLIDKSLTDPFKDRKRDAFLFGEKLGDLVKDSRGIKKTGQLIQSSTLTTNLNGKGPSSRGARQQQRGGQTYRYYRTGGPRPAMTAMAYQYPSRRRAAPALPPPPPPGRRYAAQPPPPAPAQARRPPPPAQRASTSRQT